MFVNKVIIELPFVIISMAIVSEVFVMANDLNQGEYIFLKLTFPIQGPYSLTELKFCLSLAEYCREEFEKFTTFLTSKSAEIGQFSGEIGQFSE